ncbi:hypothetical protein PAXINDRAFT_102295 [Paxillus involutus ATCC 200175]|uniref:Uncharacterized protein n=1 Tax=Paxillus involutus ATCC 200175 TaxID=664439 RepID=A0A0C9SPW2_PAXIN|nr:hypothetical protein PAXINDRAFT_102295 [Paxillus involutus ATCC 200175]
MLQPPNDTTGTQTIPPSTDKTNAFTSTNNARDPRPANTFTELGPSDKENIDPVEANNRKGKKTVKLIIKNPLSMSSLASVNVPPLPPCS